MIIKKIKSLVFFLMLTPIYAFSFTLELGESRKEVEKSTLKEIYNKYQTLPGFLFEISEGKYFSLSKTGNAIGKFDLKDDQDVLSGWRVASPDTCESSDDDCEISWWAGRWSNQEFLEPLLKERFHYNSGGEIQVMSDGLGCLNETPLRYGDVDGDSKNELVLFLNDNLLIFDTELGKTVFLSLYNLLGDHTSLEDTIEQHTKSDPTFPQHVSSIATNSGAAFKNDATVIEPAYKVYAKHYVHDFDNNQGSDLVVWRKFYQSRLQGDSVKGYEKVSDTYLHYSKVDGEYQLETDTAPETIQGWLTSKNLTWQSGFPSKSECAGQEGQLIPEMHDLLLNDPDVLK
jgi:hypothetical protein